MTYEQRLATDPLLLAVQAAYGAVWAATLPGGGGTDEWNRLAPGAVRLYKRAVRVHGRALASAAARLGEASAERRAGVTA